MRPSSRFSLLVFIRGDFADTGRFRWWFVVRSVGSSVWGPASNLPVFSFLVSFCGAAADLLFSTSVRCFHVWSTVSDIVALSSTVRYACTSFLFFSGSLLLHAALLNFSLLSVSLSLRCFEQFRLRFVYLDRSSSIFSIRLLLQFSFSSVFRPAVSQRPSLIFLVRFFRA